MAKVAIGTTRMEQSTVIKSAHDGTTLEFSNRSGGYYRVSLAGPDIHGACHVYDEPEGHPNLFFRDLARNWRGWQGKKEWGSLEGELRFAATSDSTGHTTLSVQFRSGPYRFDWSLSAGLLIEAGNLEHIASEIEKFFGH